MTAFKTLPDHDTGAFIPFEEWHDKAYRDAYLHEAIDQGIAWQIRINRERRGLSQEQLAIALGMAPCDVARLEDPDSSAPSLETLKSVARAFDCALFLRLVPFSALAAETDQLSPDAQFAAPFTAEIANSHQRGSSSGAS